jgi:hypothetical protein
MTNVPPAQDPASRGSSLPARTGGSLGPVVGGLLLDLVDLATFGPVGLYGGFVLGGALGWWMAASYGLSRRARVLAALGAAAYSATPATEFIPLGTIAGVLLKWRYS